MKECLRAMMERRKISQAELARISGVPQPIISNILSGKTPNPSAKTALKLARALRCAVEDLIVIDQQAG